MGKNGPNVEIVEDDFCVLAGQVEEQGSLDHDREVERWKLNSTLLKSTDLTCLQFFYFLTAWHNAQSLLGMC